MIDPKIALVLVAAGMLYYGGIGAIRAVGHVAKATGQVISQPFRHPVKDAKAVKHAVIRGPKIHDCQNYADCHSGEILLIPGK